MKQIILIVYFALACSALSFANLRLLTSSFTHPDLAKWAAENPVVLENFTKQDFVGLPVKNDNDYEEAKTEANKIANAHGFLVFSFDAYALAPESDSMFKAKIDAKIKASLGYNYQGAYVAFLMLRESLDDNSFVFQSVINWANYGRSNALTAPQKNSIAINTETWAKQIFDGDFSQRAWAASSGTKKLKAFLDEDPEAYFLINLKKFKQNETIFVPTNTTLEIFAFKSDGTPIDITEWSKIGNITPLINKDIKNKAVFKMSGSSKDETGNELIAKGNNDYHCKVRIVAISISIHRKSYESNPKDINGKEEITDDNQDYSALDNNQVAQYPSFYANSYFNSYNGKGYKYYNNDRIGIPYQFIPKNKSVTIKIKSEPRLIKNKLISSVGNSLLFNVLNIDSETIICCSNNYTLTTDTASLFLRVGNEDGFLLSLGILQSDRVAHPAQRFKYVKFYLLEGNDRKTMKYTEEFMAKANYFVTQFSKRFYQNIGFEFKIFPGSEITPLRGIQFDAITANSKLDIAAIPEDPSNNIPAMWGGEAIPVITALNLNNIQDLSTIHIVLFDDMYFTDGSEVTGAGLRGNAVFFASFKKMCGGVYSFSSTERKIEDDNFIMKTFGHEIGHILGLRHPKDNSTNIFKAKYMQDNKYICKSCGACQTCGMFYIEGLTDPLNIMDYGPNNNYLFRKYQWDILFGNFPISDQ